jgi:transcriptional regulator with XRE-family HTH domain
MNRGALTLQGIAKRRKLRQKDLATALDMGEPRVSRLLRGEVLPNRQEGVVLRRVYKIDPALWDKPAVGVLSRERRDTGTDG